MAALTTWLQDWRAIADGVRKGYYESITAEHAGRDYEVLQISGFDSEVDGPRRVVRTPARKFDDKVALFTRRTRDLGIVRVIIVRGQPKYVLEPGADALDWAADVEGVSKRELTDSVREGAVGRLVARAVKKRMRKSREAIEAQVQALRERAKDAEDEAATLWAELRARESQLAKFVD